MNPHPINEIIEKIEEKIMKVGEKMVFNIHYIIKSLLKNDL